MIDFRYYEKQVLLLLYPTTKNYHKPYNLIFLVIFEQGL